MLSRQCKRCAATLAAATRSRIRSEVMQYSRSHIRSGQYVHRGTLTPTASFNTSAPLYKRKVAQNDTEELDDAEEEDYGIDEKMISAMTPIVETKAETPSKESTESFDDLCSTLKSTLSDVQKFKASRPRDAMLLKLVEASSEPQHADAILPVIKLWHSRQLAAMSPNARHLLIVKMSEIKRPQFAAEIFLDPAQYGIHPRIEDLRLVIAEIGKTISSEKESNEEPDLASLDLMYTLLASLPYYSMPEKDPFILGSLISACKKTGGEEATSRATETLQELKEIMTDDVVEAIRDGTKHEYVRITRRRIEQDRQTLIDGLESAVEMVEGDLAEWCKTTLQRLRPVSSS